MSRGKTSASSRVLRVLLGGLLVATCVRVWVGPVTWVPQACAQIPDAGAQRAEFVREVRRTNDLLGQILKTLQTQTLKVEISGTDNKKTALVRPGTTRSK